MKYKDLRKLFIAGMVVNFLSVAVPALSYFLFRGVFELEPHSIWKWHPQDPFVGLTPNYVLVLVVINTLLALYFAFLYYALRKSLPDKGSVRGIRFGLLIYPVSVLIPIYSLFVLLNIAPAALVYFAIEGLIEFVLYGAAVGNILDKD